MPRLLIRLITILTALWTATFVSAANNDLAEILAAQPDDVQARFAYRHPQGTLEFFGIEPGMTVVEVLPGRGWYTKILLPYLGSGGKLIGADYPIEAWNSVYSNEEFLESRKTWPLDWSAEAREWFEDGGAEVDAFILGSLPDSLQGSADAFLFIRAMHNLNHPEPEGSHLKAAIQSAWDALKPGGIVGIVQHHARDEMSDEWANGSNGYLKRGYVVGLMEEAGFELVGESDINANKHDRPSESDIVWRLPPNFAGTERDDVEAREALQAIGESNRMTLKFVKP